VKDIQGHKVKHSNHNKAAADCPISLSFGTQFHHIRDNTLEIF